MVLIILVSNIYNHNDRNHYIFSLWKMYKVQSFVPFITLCHASLQICLFYLLLKGQQWQVEESNLMRKTSFIVKYFLENYGSLCVLR